MTRPIHRLGTYEVTTLFDGVFRTGTDMLAHADGAEARRALIERWPAPKIELDVNCFALRGPDGVTLIDAGSGSGWNDELGQSWQSLRQAGIAPGDIERILLTHLHFDHARGVLDGEAAYFPRAEILVPAVELAFYASATVRDAMPKPRRGAFPITETILRAYDGRLRPIFPGEVLPGIESISVPGHTMGQSAYLLRSEGEAMLFWADAVHLGAAQTEDPDISTIFDYDPKLAAKTRWWLLDRCAAERWLIAGSHVTGFSRIEPAGDAFRLLPA